MTSKVIEVEATGELTTLAEANVTTFRFEQTLPQSPLVLMMHLNVDTSMPGLDTIPNAKIRVSIEVPDIPDKFNIDQPRH